MPKAIRRIDSHGMESGSIIVVPPFVFLSSVHEFNFAETVCSQIETNSRAIRAPAAQTMAE
jgi:hypothetical protein